MRIAVTGSHGLIGTALVALLEAEGDEVHRLVRGAAGPSEIAWDPERGTLAAADLEGFDGVVNLAGAGIGEQRWTESRKQTVKGSRVAGTELLSRTLARLDRPPPVLLSGSAVGYYGDRGDEVLTEGSGAGTGFLADVCQRWEAATADAEAAGIRVVHLRSGIVLARRGGALAKQLPLFRLGVGGRLGSGRQYTSWITLADEVGAIRFALRSDELKGPLNVTAPNPVTNAELSAALGRALHRPVFVPVPALALRLVMGAEMTTEMLLASQRVIPEVLAAAGFRFSEPDVGDALRQTVGLGPDDRG